MPIATVPKHRYLLTEKLKAKLITMQPVVPFLKIEIMTVDEADYIALNKEQWEELKKFVDEEFANV